MKSIARALTLNSGKLRFSPAVVIEDEQDDGTVRVRLNGPGPLPIISARVALPRAGRLTANDRVLIAGDPAEELYVIGLIGSLQPQTERPTVLRTNNGAYALISGSEHEADRLQVYSPRNELIFEYDPVHEKARVNVTKGCLELSTEEGDIELRSAQTIRIGGKAIEMNGNALTIKADSARWMVSRLETVVETLVEKARSTYRTVEKLAQLRTGRMRTLVDQTFQFKSRKAFLKSEEDFKIKGKRIHLG
jgi:hypothetical protein